MKVIKTTNQTNVEDSVAETKIKNQSNAQNEESVVPETLQKYDLPELEKATKAISLKRKRLTASQKKRLRNLMATGKSYGDALKMVLQGLKEESADSTACKRPRIEAVNQLKVNIVSQNFPAVQLSLDDLKMIQNAIMLELQKLTADAPQIRFESCILKSECMVVTCADAVSRDWLEQVVKKLHTRTNQKQLKVIKDLDAGISKHKIAKASFAECSLSAEKILNLLRLQNRSLSISEWTVLNRQIKGKDTLLTLSLDNASADRLTELGNCPYFNMGRVQFMVCECDAMPTIDKVIEGKVEQHH